jgi:1-acyl-sn-glycerol-3-phosphate acyltransferase
MALNMNDGTPDVLLEVVRRMSDEIHPHKKTRAAVALDSSLERDLGFDSLARMELFNRVEQAFELTLPEHLYGGIETPRDLWRIISAGMGARQTRSFKEVKELNLGEVETTPHQARTLLEVLKWHVHTHQDRPHVMLYTEDKEEDQITYGVLQREAEIIAAGLLSRGLKKGQSVAIMLPTGRDYLFTFFAILIAGGIPVPIYPPVRRSQIEDHLRRHAAILGNALASMLITFQEAQTVGRLLSSQVAELHTVATVQELRVLGSAGIQSAAEADDIALLQYTSGSTGTPKGVVLTHANLLANIRIMGRKAEVKATDVFVSWLPLYHDMGLIGAWLGSLYYAMPLVLMSPLAFLARPKRWLWAIHRHRATFSAGPNFAYELCLGKIDDEEIAGLDLSSWRIASNGAEPVSPETLRRFSERFAKYGFSPNAMTPVYGLAECTLGLAFPPVGRGPLIDAVDRESFYRSGRAEPARPDDTEALHFVSCGEPLPGYQVRILDATWREVGERQEGRLEFRGPSTTTGYYRNPEETRLLFNGPWLNSGDRAYIAAGEIYVTGRDKDTIIRAGRNLYPYELEEAIGNLARIRKGCVAVFGSTDAASGTERLVVVAETRETEPEVLAGLRSDIESLSIDLLGIPPEQVLLAPPRTVLKTSSGKIRRSGCRELFESGHLGKRARSPWWQIVRLAWTGVLPELRRAADAGAAFLYAGYAWIIFSLFALIAWVGLLILPGVTLRRTLLHKLAGLLIKATGTPVSVRGLDQLPPREPFVIVSNHASYLDSLILTAVLPPRFGFVAKRELTHRFISRIPLRRIQTVFVERFEKKQSVEDTRETSQVLRRGNKLIFFPEGTIVRMPGLLPFFMGAFVAAAEAGTLLVPVTIRGTRSMLRAGQWLPRRGVVTVTIGSPLKPDGSGWSSALKLRDSARAEILGRCGEPDLTDQDYPILERPSR